MAICLHKPQANMFFEQDTFEVDMSFQRLRRKDIKEVTFAGFMGREGRGMPTNLLHIETANRL